MIIKKILYHFKLFKSLLNNFSFHLQILNLKRYIMKVNIIKYLLVFILVNFSYLSYCQISLLKDINNNGDCTFSKRSEMSNGKSYFPAKNEFGGELWETDGTINGTKLVKDIKLGSGSSNPKCLYPVGNILYFIADDGINGNELWRTDSIQGAVLVKDIHSGLDNTNFTIPFEEKGTFCNIGDKIYFIVEGEGIYESDGTETGTKLLYSSVDNYKNLRNIVSYNGNIYFLAETISNFPYTNILKYNFSTNKIHYVTNDEDPSNLISTPLGLIFDISRNLYISNGNYLNKTLLMTAPSSFDYKFTNSSYFFKDNFYFVVDTTYPLAPQLYKTNGTFQGTKLVKKIATEYYATYGYFKSTDDYLFFLFNNKSSDNSFTSRSLWRTDGTDDGTIKLDSFYGGSLNSLSKENEMGVYNNRLYYYAPKTNYGLLSSTSGNPSDIVNEDTLNTFSKLYTLTTGIMPVKYGITFITQADENKSIGEELWRLLKPKQKFSIQINEISKIKCFGDTTGSINASIAGGFPPYNLTWSNKMSDTTLTNLSAGTYTITVIDYINNIYTSSYKLNQPFEIKATITSTKSKINAMEGTVKVTNVTGGKSPYKYYWNTPNLDSTSSVINLNPGKYFVTIVDANDCIKIDSAIVDINTSTDMLKSNINISIFPNPTKSKVSINMFSFDKNEAYFELLDINGLVYFKQKISNSISEIDLETLANGFYFIKVFDGSNLYSEKLIKY